MHFPKKNSKIWLQGTAVINQCLVRLIENDHSARACSLCKAKNRPVSLEGDSVSLRRKYPIGIRDFETIRRDGYVYVDKTPLLYKMFSEGIPYFLSYARKYVMDGRPIICIGLSFSSTERNITDWCNS